MGQKKRTSRVTKPWTYPTNSNQQQINFKICYFFVLWQVTYALKNCFGLKKLDPKGYEILNLSLVSNQQWPSFWICYFFVLLQVNYAWNNCFGQKITYLWIGYLHEYEKTTKSKFGLLLVAICWKVKVGSGFSNPWGPTFLAPNNFLMHSLLDSVQKNNIIKNLVAVGCCWLESWGSSRV